VGRLARVLQCKRLLSVPGLDVRVMLTAEAAPATA